MVRASKSAFSVGLRLLKMKSYENCESDFQDLKVLLMGKAWVFCAKAFWSDRILHKVQAQGQPHFESGVHFRAKHQKH